ncbi:LysR family transcriptional regulator [Maritimibacter sp. 55A14]|uniref:LysR family transcriptional regulator n=1 Tax=Maritimibacter sp. 55A14 TaxID=2174844 RepID=UPI000D616A40|nr:LysR family transcriptional regulator [Maritimibacter sp. 55A14]PWE29865.1 LysR family transcriptional regulator [Maritimibacter sp. 55A14]
MDIVDQLKAFVATAQTGSFTAAADQLGVSNRLTSKYVAELEAHLGVRLFQRTTRKVGLTSVGEDLLARAPGLLDDLDDILSEVSEGSQGFSGVIRISAPVTFGELYVARMLGRFASQHPNLSIDLRLSDRYVDLASEGIDLAFRIGVTDTLSIKGRKLGSFESVITASPDYLAEIGAPEMPEDLSHHACIVDTNRRSPRRWTLFRDGKELPVTVAGRFHVNSAQAACDLATDGHGIAYSPRFAAAKALESGRLVELFPGYQCEHSPVSAIYLEGRALPRKTRALIDFATHDIRAAQIV